MCFFPFVTKQKAFAPLFFPESAVTAFVYMSEELSTPALEGEGPNETLL
jgi:hypothetical protein